MHSAGSFSKSLGMNNLNFSYNREYPVPISHNLELVVDGSTQRYNLPDSNQLEGQRVIGFMVRANDSGSNRKSKNARDLVSETALKQGHISIVDKNHRRVIDELPLEVCSFDNLGDGGYIQFDQPLGLDTTESTVTFQDAASINNGEALEIIFIVVDNC